MKGRNTQKAVETFQKMKKDQCQPTTTTYTMMINLYGKVFLWHFSHCMGMFGCILLHKILGCDLDVVLSPWHISQSGKQSLFYTGFCLPTFLYQMYLIVRGLTWNNLTVAIGKNQPNFARYFVICCKLVACPFSIACVQLWKAGTAL